MCYYLYRGRRKELKKKRTYHSHTLEFPNPPTLLKEYERLKYLSGFVLHFFPFSSAENSKALGATVFFRTFCCLALDVRAF